MNAEELMIGDWVEISCFDGSKVMVQITLPINTDQISCKSNLGNHWACLDDVHPIPLTAEILEKNGFIRDMFYGEWQFDLDTFPYDFPFSVVQRENNSWYLGREEIGIAHNREIIDISYVHELQHALRLCGIEKEIIL